MAPPAPKASPHKRNGFPPPMASTMSAPRLHDGLRVAPCPGQVSRVSVMRQSVVRIQRDSLPVQPFGASPVPFVIRFFLGKRNRSSQPVVEFQGLFSGRPGTRPRILARKNSPTCEVIVSVRQTGPCPSIAWVLFNRLLEIHPALLEIALPAACADAARLGGIRKGHLPGELREQLLCGEPLDYDHRASTDWTSRARRTAVLYGRW